MWILFMAFLGVKVGLSVPVTTGGVPFMGYGAEGGGGVVLRTSKVGS